MKFALSSGKDQIALCLADQASAGNITAGRRSPSHELQSHELHEQLMPGAGTLEIVPN